MKGYSELSKDVNLRTCTCNAKQVILTYVKRTHQKPASTIYKANDTAFERKGEGSTVIGDAFVFAFCVLFTSKLLGEEGLFFPKVDFRI